MLIVCRFYRRKIKIKIKPPLREVVSYSYFESSFVPCQNLGNKSKLRRSSIIPFINSCHNFCLPMSPSKFKISSRLSNSKSGHFSQQLINWSKGFKIKIRMKSKQFSCIFSPSLDNIENNGIPKVRMRFRVFQVPEISKNKKLKLIWTKYCLILREKNVKYSVKSRNVKKIYRTHQCFQIDLQRLPRRFLLFHRTLENAMKSIVTN